MLAPSLILIALYSVYPAFEASTGSLFAWSRDRRLDFNGLNNYRSVLTDPIFWKACGNVLLWALWVFTVPFVIPILVAEGIFNLRNRMAKSFFRIAILIPVLIPGLVTILLWKWIYSSPDGGLNLLLKGVGLPGLTHTWLNDTATALPAMLMLGFPWFVGIAPLIYLAGLLTMPADLGDAAQIDGASKWQRIRYIDLPHLVPQIRLFLVFGVIALLQNIATPLALTKGGPFNSTLVPGLYMYNEAFGIQRFDKPNIQMGNAMAVGVLIVIVILVLTVSTARFVRDRT